MTTSWEQIDHDPTSIASRPRIRMRHMSMSGGCFHDSPTATTFHTIDDANAAITQIAEDNAHALGGVVHETDPLSLVPGAMHVVIHWGLVSDRYHLDAIDYAPIKEN
ncbi:hypothetical protein [Mycobacterium sp. SMC-17]|uniref:hypothetical protein n=1 Tax=Mycobacterium sp. SMC-17 TaxID=3381628 RepID=UPI0038771212